jgi:hypothetical protein
MGTSGGATLFPCANIVTPRSATYQVIVLPFETSLLAKMPYHFLELIEGLKNTTRKGWTLRGIPNPESVSDHMYRMAVMCLMLPGVSYMRSPVAAVDKEPDR